MNEFDSSASPSAATTDASTRGQQAPYRMASDGVTRAIKELNEHLGDPEKAQADLDAAGSRFRRITWGITGGAIVMSIITVLVVDILATDRLQPDDRHGVLVLIGITVLCIAAAVPSIVGDLRFPLREELTTPQETLLRFFNAIGNARYGYAWSLLCPTAREQRVTTPRIGPNSIVAEDFDLLAPVQFEQYVDSFHKNLGLRDGNGESQKTYGYQVKRVTLLQEDGDVAKVEVMLQVWQFPSWPSAVFLPSLLLVYPFRRILLAMIALFAGIIVFGFLWLILRKNCYAATFCKTLIRGSNGLWYIQSGDLTEDRADVPLTDPKKRERKPLLANITRS